MYFIYDRNTDITYLYIRLYLYFIDINYTLTYYTTMCVNFKMFYLWFAKK